MKQSSTHVPAKHGLLLGAHLSSSGGLEKAILAAPALGCTCLQLFTHSNRQWDIAPLTQQQRADFAAARKQTGISALVAHASYLINIASDQQQTKALSRRTLAKELERCQELEIPFLVLHPGARLTQTVEQGVAAVAESLDEICEKVPGKSMILLEIMAGQGTVLGSTLEELAAMRAGVAHKKRIGFCFDTCHAFAAGYDFTTPQKYEAFWKRFDDVLGLEHLKVIHLNDSKGKLGSHLDRHANIGEGELGLEAFRLIMNDPRLFDVPKILETPYESQKDYEKNLEILRGLQSLQTKRVLS